MKDIVTRIKTIMEKEGFSAAEFADTLSVGRPLLSHVLGGRNNPSLQLLIKINEQFPAYSLDWLIQGKELAVESGTSTPPQPEVTDIKTINADNEHLSQKQSMHKPVKKSEIIRTVLFFEDGTFEEYKPR